MDPKDRRRKKVEEARRLRDVPPEETLAMGFRLMEFAQDLAEAGDRARA